jgi:hypothetical protein
VTIQCGSKVRLLHIPNLLDRVVERSIVLVLSPIYEALFHPWSFGFRKGISTVDALRELSGLCNRHQRYVLGKLDLKDAFDRIPHHWLLDVLRQWVKDEKLVGLVERIVRRPGWLNKQGKSHIGLPQGGPLSPLLFNVYVDHFFDQVIRRRHPEIVFIRWADDIVLVCKDKAQLEQQRQLLTVLLQSAGLEVNRTKTYSDAASADLQQNETIEFLGHNIGWNGKEITLHLTGDALASLYGQLAIDMTRQRPNVGWDGLERFLERQATFTIGSWLTAHAGAIPPEDWPRTRARIKGFFLEGLPEILDNEPNLPPNLPIECPNNDTLDEIYRHARQQFIRRYSGRTAITLHCDASALTEIGQFTSDCIADAADLVPAPSVLIEPYGGRKPGHEDVEWRLKFNQ